MTSATSAYAIHFNEGPGYLFVAHLGHDTFDKVMLVRSCAHPHDLYVRKRVLDKSPQNECDLHHDEILHHPPSKFVPELIDWTDYGFESYSMTTQFCNGGSLHDLLSHTLFNNSCPIAEIFMWRIFTELLQTLEYLHHERSVAHVDLTSQNVFLHWSEEHLGDQDKANHHLPDVYLGDFGAAKSVWYGLMQYDLRLLHTLMIQISLGSSREPVGLQGWKDRFPRH